jgi:transposase InsO family protein
MISHPDRVQAVRLIDEAVAAGARQLRACEEMGITPRTYQRWTAEGDGVKVDGRPTAERPTPQHKLTRDERAQILEVANSAEFQSRPPSQIVPTLADRGEYIASESSFYRVLKEANQQHHRGRSKAPERKAPTTHCATGPNQLWCWDITWLPGPARGSWYYLYLMLDVYSRKVVGWEIHTEESSELAAELVRKACLREGISGQPLVLHADNGSPMKGATLRKTLEQLGVAASYNRPRVSNDNPYAESIFRTCKYRPDYPYDGFANLVEAQEWVLRFVHWYNYEHKHSGLKFISPAQRHSGQDEAIMVNREVVYKAAKSRNPARWSGTTRDWNLPKQVWLNPEKEDRDTEEVA